MNWLSSGEVNDADELRVVYIYLIRVVECDRAPVQSPHLLWSRVTGIIQSIRTHEVDDRAEHTNHKAWIQA